MIAWQSHNSQLFHTEHRLDAKLFHYFRDIEHEVLSNLHNHLTVKADADELKVDDLMFDVQEWFHKLEVLISQESLIIIRNAFNQFLHDYSIDGIIFEPNSNLVTEAIDHLVSKVKTIPETLFDELRQTLDEGIRLQETRVELSNRIAKFFDDTNDFRAKRIAATTSNTAVNLANKLAVEKSKLFKSKIWLTRRDERVRDLHISLDGDIIPIQNKFHLANGNALDFPGDPSATQGESIINCRCTAIYSQEEV